MLFAFVLTISAVSTLGSGPYLPSGWRPSGPAFLLPSEVRTALKPIGITLEPRISEAIVLPLEPTSLEVPESTVSSEPIVLEVKIPEYTVVTSESTTEETESSGVSEDSTTESPVPPAEPVQDVFGQDTEASGSSFLREYGPPAVLDIHQSVTMQGLPDIVTEHTFRAVCVKNSQEEPVSLRSDEEVSVTFSTSEVAKKGEVPDEANATTEPESIEVEVSVQTDATIEAKSGQDASTTKAVISEVIFEVTTAKCKERITEEETTSSQSATEGTAKDEEHSVLLVKSIDAEAQVSENTSLEYLSPVSNEELSQDNSVIAKEDAVILEKPINSSDDDNSDDTVKNQIKHDEEKVEESSTLGQAPDILNERELVGFREYGPPKHETEEKSEADRIENNETRRRRFSSRFVSFNKH